MEKSKLGAKHPFSSTNGRGRRGGGGGKKRKIKEEHRKKWQCTQREENNRARVLTLGKQKTQLQQLLFLQWSETQGERTTPQQKNHREERTCGNNPQEERAKFVAIGQRGQKDKFLESCYVLATSKNPASKYGDYRACFSPHNVAN